MTTNVEIDLQDCVNDLVIGGVTRNEAEDAVAMAAWRWAELVLYPDKPSTLSPNQKEEPADDTTEKQEASSEASEKRPEGWEDGPF